MRRYEKGGVGVSALLRLEMIGIAVLALLIIVHNVNRKKLRIQYSFIWLFITASMLLAALFPGIVSWLCNAMGIETPVNLVYLLGILILLLITFFQTILISRQADQIKRLTQIISIEKFLVEEGGDRHDGKKPEG